MNRILPLLVCLPLLSGCVKRPSHADLNTVATLASEHTAKNVHRLFQHAYDVDQGVVVKVEEHPVDYLSSAGTPTRTYHIEYGLRIHENRSLELYTRTYVLPITEVSHTPRFAVGDKVRITGWIEKREDNQPPGVGE